MVSRKHGKWMKTCLLEGWAIVALRGFQVSKQHDKLMKTSLLELFSTPPLKPGGSALV